MLVRNCEDLHPTSKLTFFYNIFGAKEGKYSTNKKKGHKKNTKKEERENKQNLKERLPILSSLFSLSFPSSLCVTFILFLLLSHD